ncbi:hypothetical protein SAMN02910413_2293 [Pseudobutyrivibrio sp. C4]|uniref:hypothetical protein n=1 Tax=Pseudobutyrivibrio sp. C4 TaxID=1520803 RepID=UPI0008B89B23|nr:hypothetical protein [Pseudobutyrivibrio sp. C4]SET25688.1 hypothetical protein SAMN02910413_2293 [Pseudobutyrivibrio sp. C4]
MKKLDLIKIVSYIYIALPLAFFIFGWTKIYLIGAPLTIAIFVSLYRMAKNAECRTFNIIESKKDIIKIVIIITIILLWVYFSGIGGYTWQNNDHKWRNEIFEILIEYKWPVVKGTAYGSNGMSYYIGFWIIPAMIGKLFGVNAGYFAQYVWAVIGVSLVYLLISKKNEGLYIWPLLIFVFFSGLDIIGLLLRNNDAFFKYTFGMHIDNWAVGYQFSSFTTQLFWVFNQAIYGWIVTLLVLDENNANMVLVMAAGLFSAPLPVVGLFPMALCRIWNNSAKDNHNGISGIIKKAFTSLITYENVIGIISAVVVGSMFLSNNAISYTALAGGKNNVRNLVGIVVLAILIVSVVVLVRRNILKGKQYRRIEIYRRIQKVSIIALKMFCALFIIYGAIHTIPSKNSGTMDNNLLYYILFLLVEVGVYIALTYRIGKKDNIYIASIIMFLICPIFVIGSSVDFCMRACIPAQIILYMYIVMRIKDLVINRNKMVIAVLTVSLLLGSVTTVSEFARTINNYPDYKENGIEYARKEQIMESMNFCSSVDDSIFYKYLAQY